MPDVKLEPSWKKELAQEFDKPYWQDLTDFVRSEYASKTIYPPGSQILRAFDMCPFDKVKVVIVGQDPYHGPKQANGLSFAVSDGVALPPSLQNIYKEIKSDLGIEPLQSGDLSRWAKQGVLMLNSVLTVAAGNPASHKGQGWEIFTDAVIDRLNRDRDHIVYLLWGKYARAKGEVIDRQKNLVLESAHPSPFSATLFYGHHHFSQANAYLALSGEEPIDWR
ncbi:MAG TPA: uracil-DNA glycosylase [Patescibacteria group bacterium]|nr:uracil-DNA glycosylase [Patescibacteria group bacterium]